MAKDLAEGSTELDVAIVGAGVGGLYAIHRLRELGLKVRAYEAGSGVGGTWFWNRYPGCRCDVESLEYSYSFSNDLQQDWKWPERYGTQPEILRYINHVADRFDLLKDVQLETRIRSAQFDRDSKIWTLVSEAGDIIVAPYVVMATGNLSTPQMPPFKGLDRFKGDWYHTGLWPQEGVDFSGKRVAVIGTGSSGVQMIPHIARQADHLYVFQRTANFSLPARNAPMDADREARHKAEYVERRTAAYDTPFGIAGYPAPTKTAAEATPGERRAQYEAKWAEGGSISFLFSYTDLLTDEEANKTAADFVRDKIRETVNDPEVAELLCPIDHPIGTKRLILDTGYYETYNRDNVTLVNARKAPIDEITDRAIRTADGKSYEVDAIAFAIGFDAMTGAMKQIDIRAAGGPSIQDKWEDGPTTYLGIMVNGFPNLFMVTGPQSPGVKSQMILSCEQHVDFIADCIAHMRNNGQRMIEPTREAEAGWVEHVREVGEATLYPKANSWYMGANIPGKARIFMPYVAGVHKYTEELRAVVDGGYKGFVISA